MEVLNTFCDISGQTINFAKSKLFVSANINRRLSNLCRIPLTNDLGKYLGIPLFHSRVNKNHFNQIIEKVQRTLSGWSSNTLMLAGRVTLAQSVTTTIPSYTMQTMKLPASVCEHLDRLNKNFIWGDTPDRKKLHLVKWDKVCKDKDCGGLGIKSAKKQNLALLAKLGWKMYTQEDCLWVNILRDKYLCNHDIFSWPRHRPASHI